MSRLQSHALYADKQRTNALYISRTHCAYHESVLFHACSYAAAALFDDGSLATMHQLKAAEYGSTVDPVTLLMPAMLQKKAAEAIDPAVIVQVHCNAARRCSRFAPSFFRSPVIGSRCAGAHVFTQVDQFGNLHAPFATARALLTEHGFSSVRLLVQVHALIDVHITQHMH